MEQKTILDAIKESKKQNADIIKAINNSKQIAFVFPMVGSCRLLADNKNIPINPQLIEKILDCFDTNKRKYFTNIQQEDEYKDNNGNTVTKCCYYCNGGNCGDKPQYTDINDEDFKKKINTAIEEAPMSVGSGEVTTTNNHIHLSQEINNDSKTMLSANITADMNGKIENIELHYTDDVEIKNQEQLKELNELLNNNIHEITKQGIDIDHIMEFLSKLTKKKNKVDIDEKIKKKFNFIYDKLLNLNQEYDGIKKDVENLQYAIRAPTNTYEPINAYYLSLNAIKQDLPKYKHDIDTAIKLMSSKIDKFKKKLQDVNGNANEKIEATLNEMGKKLYDTTFGICEHGIGYKPNENKIIQSDTYGYYDNKNKCMVNTNMVEIKLDQQYDIECLLFIDKTNKKTIKILPKIPFYINDKKFHLENCILHHNAGFCTNYINGGDAENSITKPEQFEQIEKQQIDYIISTKSKSFNCSNQLLKQCMQKIAKTDNVAEQLNYLINNEDEIKKEVLESEKRRRINQYYQGQLNIVNRRQQHCDSIKAAKKKYADKAIEACHNKKQVKNTKTIKQSNMRKI